MHRTLIELPRNRTTFQSGPQPIQALVAAVLEPTLTVIVFLAASAWFGESPGRPGLFLCLLVYGMSFPGRDRFEMTPGRAARAVLSSWIVVAGLLGLVGYATQSLGLFKAPVLLSWAVATPLVHWSAIIMGRQWLLHRRRQLRTRSVVVVGAGHLAARLARALQSRPELDSEFLGYFDDRSEEREGAEGLHTGRLGNLADAAAYIRSHGVSEVHITLPVGAQPRMRALVEQLQNTTATIYVVPDVSGVSVIQGRLQDIDGIPMVGICDTPFTGTDQLVKRASDLVLASVILVLISPVLLAVAIGVKASSPGPVLFKQRRNGLNGQEILVYKFRSMRVMENGAVVRQATRNDPRLTRFGAFIRRTSLDELPQFINVLQGRMSIVGPRPHAVAHNEHYCEVVRAYMARHKVKPGITGWAQIHGHRGETDTLEKMQARVEYDLEYLRHWSLALDLKIILRTVRVVFKDDSAY